MSTADTLALWNAYAAERVAFEENPSDAAERRCVETFEAWATEFTADAVLAHEMTELLRHNLVRARQVLA